MYKNKILMIVMLINATLVMGQCPLVITYDAAGNRIYRGNDCDPNCSLLVTTLLDDGPGSLRRAIQCAADGDTIKFAPAVIGQYINLSTGEIPVNKSIFITQTNSSIVNVNANNLGPIFNIVTGNTYLSHLRLAGSLETGKHGRSIINRSHLTLDNITIEDADLVEGNGSSVMNYGDIIITGNTKIIIGTTF